MVTFIVRYGVAVYFILVFPGHESRMHTTGVHQVSHFRRFACFQIFFILNIYFVRGFLYNYQISHVAGFHKQPQCDIRQLYLSWLESRQSNW